MMTLDAAIDMSLHLSSGQRFKLVVTVGREAGPICSRYRSTAAIAGEREAEEVPHCRMSPGVDEALAAELVVCPLLARVCSHGSVSSSHASSSHASRYTHPSGQTTSTEREFDA